VRQENYIINKFYIDI